MGMKAVGLVSGGKDSVFAMHCAHELGHHICAVATLLPRDGLLETDSFMYQSVGTALTMAIAECLGIPYFSAYVKGQPLATDTLSYHTTKGDEVEDLHDLLLRVKEEIPGLQAVTCGAILSEFQRRRLEQVCQRLNLVPICLMWKREQEEILQSMIDWGLNAVLVKTSSMGLSRKHLGRSISELQPIFMHLKRQHDFHVCGEGGEYETLTLDCPFFRNGSIAVSEWREVCLSEDPVAPVYLSSPVKWTVLPKHPVFKGAQVPDPESLCALELRRFQFYDDIIRNAVKAWCSGCKAGSISLSDLTANERLLTRHHGSGKQSKWVVHAHNNFSGGILSADVSVSRTVDQQLWCDDASLPTTAEPDYLASGCKDSILTFLGQWLDDQLLGCSVDDREAQSASLVQTICQVRHPELIPLVEELFASKSILPHPATFLTTPLPNSIILRFRIVLGLTGNTSSTGIVWKTPEDETVLHVHSLNWWLPPCPLGGAYKNGVACQSKGQCFNCQGVRCARLSDGPSSVAHVFLRGCDGRFPHSGALPDLACNPRLRELAGELGVDADVQQGMNVILEVANSFFNMHQVLRLIRGGGTNRGFWDVAYTRDAEPQDMAQRLASTNPPSCILAIVNLRRSENSGGETSEPIFESGGKLAIVEALVKSFVARCHQLESHDNQGTETDYPTTVIVAEVPCLPGGVKCMLLPLWEIAERRGGPASSSISLSADHPRIQAGWNARITSLMRRRDIPPDPETTPPLEEGFATCSVLVRISFSVCDYDAERASFGFHINFCKVIEGVLEKHVVQGNIGNQSDATSRVHVKQQLLEVLVFYSVPCASRLWNDMKAFEAACLENISRACRRKMLAFPVSPTVTFLPVKYLSQGLVDVLCALS